MALWFVDPVDGSDSYDGRQTFPAEDMEGTATLPWGTVGGTPSELTVGPTTIVDLSVGDVLLLEESGASTDAAWYEIYDKNVGIFIAYVNLLATYSGENGCDTAGNVDVIATGPFATYAKAIQSMTTGDLIYAKIAGSWVRYAPTPLIISAAQITVPGIQVCQVYLPGSLEAQVCSVGANACQTAQPSSLEAQVGKPGIQAAQVR